MKLANFKYILENKTEATWEQLSDALASHPYKKDWLGGYFASTCVNLAIHWGPTPQGSGFWDKVSRQLISFDDAAVEKLRALELQKDVVDDGLNIPLWEAEERIMLEDENEQMGHNAREVHSDQDNSVICSDISPEINRDRDMWACGCSLLLGHSCGKEVDATKGLGLVDRERAHRDLVLEIKSTIEGEKR